MQKEGIKQKIIYGDMVTIARMTGYSHEYVKKVLDPNDKRTNKTIEDTASKLIEMRELIAAGINPHNMNVA